MIKSREIDVRNQSNLSLQRTFEMCWKGILHRLLRSVLTLAVVVLAVAFFMFLLSENAFIGATAQGVFLETNENRFAAQLISKLYEPPPLPSVARRLALAASQPALLAEAAAFTGLPVDRLEGLARQAARERRYLQFIDTTPPGKAVVLFGKARGRELFKALAEAAAFTHFAARLAPMLDLDLPDGVDGFRAFLDGYAAYEAELLAVVVVWEEAVARLTAASRQQLWGRTPMEVWLAEATPEQLAAWQALLDQHGVGLTDDQADRVRQQFAAGRLRQQVLADLNSADGREKWRRVFMERRHIPAEEKMKRLDDQRVHELFEGKYSRQQLALVANLDAVDRRLTRLERLLAGKVDLAGTSLIGPRQFFLLLISFVVCMVGIANAMLMSITERFREIATMKCLGATDRYILVQFMLEAALQGICGGLLGMLIGFVIALLKNALLYGHYVVAYWPGLELGAGALFSLAVGVVLAVLASIYPSWAASRMAPMEAMRVE